MSFAGSDSKGTGKRFKVTKLHITNGYSDDDTVKNCRLDFKDRTSGAWQEAQSFTSKKTSSRQTFDISSSRAAADWRFVVIDTYGGYSYVHKLEFEGTSVVAGTPWQVLVLSEGTEEVVNALIKLMPSLRSQTN